MWLYTPGAWAEAKSLSCSRSSRERVQRTLYRKPALKPEHAHAQDWRRKSKPQRDRETRPKRPEKDLERYILESRTKESSRRNEKESR